MNRILVETIYMEGPLSRLLICPDRSPQAILVSDWLISKKSSPLLKER
jgi:hypothetical protein